jgi:hypothetical protein
MNCPQCGHQLLEDFGVVTCQSCLAVMSIDLEGKIFLQEKKEIEELEVEKPHTNEDLLGDELFSLDSFDQLTQTEPTAQVVDSEQTEKKPSENLTEEANRQKLIAEEIVNEKHFTEDIISFAENTATSDKLIYKVVITDLNLTEQKQKLVDILSDPKFHLSASRLLAEVKEGTLIISELNSVKASILVKKLLMEKFHVDWTQNAY